MRWQEKIWSWRERSQKVFKKLKERFITKLVLVTLNLDKEMRVEANISDFAIRKVRNYKIHNKIWTDYKNLEYFIKAQKLNQR